MQIYRMQYRVSKIPVLSVCAAYLFIGLGLLLQSDRWVKTPAYENLLNLLPQETWGFIYISVAILVVISFYLVYSPEFWFAKLLHVISHSLAIALTAIWLFAFVVRWFTNESTTVVTWVCWSCFLIIIIQSSLIQRSTVMLSEENQK